MSEVYWQVSWSADGRSPARTLPSRTSESLGAVAAAAALGSRSARGHSVTVMSSWGGRRMSRADGARAAGGGVSANGARRPRYAARALVDATRRPPLTTLTTPAHLAHHQTSFPTFYVIILTTLPSKNDRQLLTSLLHKRMNNALMWINKSPRNILNFRIVNVTHNFYSLWLTPHWI